MIKKILSIKNVGKFLDYSCHGDVDFRDFNIVYADNGRGKTTLSTIYKSLQIGDGDLITGRKTLGSTDGCSIEILFTDNNKSIFKDGKWNQLLPQLVVFDESFISENVYSGFSVNHQHKRNLHNFVLGEKGVLIANEIDQISEDNKEKASEIKEIENQIKTHIIGDIEIMVFLKLDPPPEGSVLAKEKELSSVRTADEIEKRNLLNNITFPIIPIEDINEVLGTSISDVSNEVEKTITDHIKKCMDENGEKWIETGLDYVDSDQCPFCDQSLENNRLFSAYKSYFDESYQNLKSRITINKQKVQDLLSEDSLLNLLADISSNNELIEFWKNHLSGKFPSLDFDKVQKCIQSLRKYLIDLLSNKTSAPLDIISPLDLEEDTNFSCYLSISKEVKNYNKLVENLNILIDTKKEAVKGSDLGQIENDLSTLRNSQIRNTPEVSKRCEDYKIMLKDKKTLEQTKVDKKEELDNYANNIFKEYGELLNENLRRCGVDYRIVEIERNYIGGKPRTEYCLKIESETIKLGDGDTPQAEASFKNTLSSGDKSTLAFSFFISKLQQLETKELEKIVLIFDDPASSLDVHRRSHTCHQLIKLAQSCAQVVVMTHSYNLINGLWKDSKHLKPQSLQITRISGNYSDITNLNISEVTKPEYFKNYDSLTKFIDSGSDDDDNSRLVARCIRPLLEGYLRMRFPKVFLVDKWLGDYIQQIRDSESGDSIYPLQSEIFDDLVNINNYSKKYHHENPNYLTEPINDTELRTYAQLTISTIS